MYSPTMLRINQKKKIRNYAWHHNASLPKQALCCVVDTQFFFVEVFFLSFLAFLFVLYVIHKLYFIMLSSRLSVTHTICLHCHFLVSRPGWEGI